MIDPARSSSDAIAVALEERVLSGEIAAGDRLASERILALEYGVSRPIVREALRSLIERGLIDVEPGRGAFVRDGTGPRRFPPLDIEYRRRGTTARQLSEARLMLETEAAALANAARRWAKHEGSWSHAIDGFERAYEIACRPANGRA